MGQKNLGIVLNFDHTAPATQAPEDVAAANLWDGIFNRWYVQAIAHKTYPEEVLAGLAPHMPNGWEADMGLIGQPIDWLGINYYTRHFIAHAPGMAWPAIRDVPGDLPRTQMGWEIYPEGLESFLLRMERDYVGNLPLYVTENGMANADLVEDGIVSDEIREDFLISHLDATRRAIASGANVKGFFYWSLLDNYEWAEGYEKRFGLVHVDFATQKRVPKSSYHALARAIARND
jgi:beta-glucosidase